MEEVERELMVMVMKAGTVDFGNKTDAEAKAEFETEGASKTGDNNMSTTTMKAKKKKHKKAKKRRHSSTPFRTTKQSETWHGLHEGKEMIA
jgi:hypothetical protein